MDVPDKAQQNADFAQWEREFVMPEVAPAPKPQESRFRKVARAFFKLFDANGHHLEKRYGLDDQNRFHHDDHGEAA